MKLRTILSIIPLLILANACAWIDDIDTVEKKGSYEFTSAVEPDEENDSGPQAVTNQAIKCANKHDTLSFDVFDVNGLDDAIYQIIMVDQTRNRMNATQLSIDFKPWAPNDPATPCPPPDELLNTSIQLSLDGCVQASLAIGDCSPRQTYNITGTLTLSDFSVKRRETVAGAIDGKLNLVRYVDTNEQNIQSSTELGDFNANFQFPVHVGAVWMR